MDFFSALEQNCASKDTTYIEQIGSNTNVGTKGNESRTFIAFLNHFVVRKRSVKLDFADDKSPHYAQYFANK